MNTRDAVLDIVRRKPNLTTSDIYRELPLNELSFRAVQMALTTLRKTGKVRQRFDINGFERWVMP